VELERRSRALDEKEQGLLFLEVQLEETSAELERRAMALAMSGPTVTYHSLRLPHFAIHAGAAVCGLHICWQSRAPSPFCWTDTQRNLLLGNRGRGCGQARTAVSSSAIVVSTIQVESFLLERGSMYSCD